jgi:hypothetical protein
MFKGFLLLLFFGVAVGAERMTILIDQFNPSGSSKFYIKTEAGSFLLQLVLVKEVEEGFLFNRPAIYGNPALKWIPGDRLKIERLEGFHDFPIKFTNLETQEVAYGKHNNYENISVELLNKKLKHLERRVNSLEQRPRAALN